MKFFEGCTALVTGASSGLGAEFARQLAPYARRLVLVARRQERLEELRGSLSSLFPNLDVRIYRADLCDERERAALAGWLEEQNLPVHLLVNNAGLGDHGDFLGSDYARVKAMIETNITALTHLTHALLPRMVAGGRAAVLNVSSVAGFFPLPNMAVYSATKAYVTSFSEALRMELRPKGITVTALCPGPVPTEFFQVATRNSGGGNPEKFQVPAVLAATPSEVVYAGLRAVSRERARVVPNLALCVLVGALLLLPFCLVRKLIASKASEI